MAKAQFQGYARGKGYTSIDPGYIALTRDSEKQQRELADLKENQKEARERDLKAEAMLERSQKIEEANRKDINIEQQVLSTQEQALRTNRDQVTRNFNAELKKQEQKAEDLKSILNFSQTAVKAFQEYNKKTWDNTAESAYNYYMQHGLSTEDQIQMDLLEDDNWRRGETFENVADQMREEGYPLEEEMYVRGKNSASDYGRLKAYSVMAGDQFGTWATGKLSEMENVQTVEQKQAALEKLRIQYLKAHKLYGVSADFLDPMFTKMRNSTDRIVNKAKLDRDVEFSARRTKEKEEVLLANLNPQALNEYYFQKRREVKPNGTFYTPAEAKQAVFDLLSDVRRFPNDAAVIKLLEEAQLSNQNNTWAGANSMQVADLILQRTNAKITNDNNTKVIVEQKKKEERQALKTFLEDPTKWNGDRRVLQQGINSLRNSGHTVEELAEFLPYADQSIQGRNDGDYWTDQINGLIEDNRLTTEDLKGPFVPKDLKDKHWQKAVENEEIFKAAKIKDNVIPAIEDQLKSSLKLETIDKTTHSSFNLALYHAETEFRGQILDGVSAKDALTNVLDDIKNGVGKFNVVNPGDKGALEVQSFFGAFVPGSHKNAAKVTPTTTTDERVKVIDEVITDPSLVTKKLLIHPERLKELRDDIKAGRSYRLPQICFDLSQGDPELFGSPLDVWQAQLKAADLEDHGLKIDDFTPTLFRDTTDPLGKKMLTNLRTKADIRKILQVTYKPSSVRDPSFMSPNVITSLGKIAKPELYYLDDFYNSSDTQVNEILKTDNDYSYEIKEGFEAGTWYKFPLN
jgi:hypothetical protein